MREWIAIGPFSGGARVYSLRGETVLAQLDAADEEAALAGLGDISGQAILRIGDGVPDTLPAAVFPEKLTSLTGFTQNTPPDVIDAWVRLQAAGFLAADPNWDGILCFPGAEVTHWLHVSADEVVSSASFMTPRLVAALGGSDTPCETALNDSLARPERLAAQLRVAEVSSQSNATTGHLIGAEIAATRPYWLGQNVALIGTDGLAAGYASALRSQGVPTQNHSSNILISNGLAAIARSLGMT